jgi:hypothetical protein
MAGMDIKETNPSANVPRQRENEPLGDQGHEKTWEPPPGEQGISNRADDEATDESHEEGADRSEE